MTTELQGKKDAPPVSVAVWYGTAARKALQEMMQRSEAEREKVPFVLTDQDGEYILKHLQGQIESLTDTATWCRFVVVLCGAVDAGNLLIVQGRATGIAEALDIREKISKRLLNTFEHGRLPHVSELSEDEIYCIGEWPGHDWDGTFGVTDWEQRVIKHYGLNVTAKENRWQPLRFVLLRMKRAWEKDHPDASEAPGKTDAMAMIH